jgi:CubicO group peptidase (beta-lactamase class C family)
VVRRDDGVRRAGAYGWVGGLGTTWWNDPAADLTVVLLTNLTWSSPVPPAIHEEIVTLARAALVG